MSTAITEYYENYCFNIHKLNDCRKSHLLKTVFLYSVLEHVWLSGLAVSRSRALLTLVVQFPVILRNSEDFLSFSFK